MIFRIAMYIPAIVVAVLGVSWNEASARCNRDGTGYEERQQLGLKTLMLGYIGVICCASSLRPPAAMGSIMARYIIPSRAIFPITAKCLTAPAVTVGPWLTPSTADDWSVAT